MSFFGKGFGAAFAQTLEAVGNIVAPLPDEEDEHENLNTSRLPQDHHQDDDYNENENNESPSIFDSPSFVDSRNDHHMVGLGKTGINHDLSILQPLQDMRPNPNASDTLDSPVSYLSDVDLNDDVSHRMHNISNPSSDDINTNATSSVAGNPIISAITSRLSFHDPTGSNKNSFQSYTSNISAALFFSGNPKESESKDADPDHNPVPVNVNPMMSTNNMIDVHVLRNQSLSQEISMLKAENESLHQQLHQQQDYSHMMAQLKSELAHERNHNIQLTNTISQNKYGFDNQLSSLQAELSQLTISNASYQQQVSELYQQIEQHDKSMHDMRAEKIAADSMISKLQQSLQHHDDKQQDDDRLDMISRLQVAEATIHEQQHYDAINSRNHQLEDELRMLRDSIAQSNHIDESARIIELQRHIDDMTRKFESDHESLSQQSIDIDRLTQRESQLSDTINHLQAQLQSKVREIESCRGDMKKISYDYNSSQQQNHDIEAEMNKMKIEYEVLRSKYDDIMIQQQQHIDDHQQAQHHIQQLLSQLEQGKHRNDDLSSQLQSATSHHDKANSNTITIGHHTSQLLEANRRYEVLELQYVETQQQVQIYESRERDAKHHQDEISMKYEDSINTIRHKHMEYEKLSSDYQRCLVDIHDKEKLIHELQDIIEVAKQASITTPSSSDSHHHSQAMDDKDAEILGLMTQIQLLESRSLQSTSSSTTIHASTDIIDPKIMNMSRNLQQLIHEINMWIDDDPSNHDTTSTDGHDDMVILLTLSSAVKAIQDLRSLVIQANDELEVQLKASEGLQQQNHDYMKQIEDNTTSSSTTASEADTSKAAVQEMLILQLESTILSLEQELQQLHQQHRKVDHDYNELLQLSSKMEVYEAARVASQNELISVQAELAQAHEATNTLKAKLNKIETESKQYQTVITQLRSARKINKEDIDSVLSEREELRKKVEFISNEHQRVSRLLAQANDDVNRYQSYEKEYHIIKERHHQLDRDYMILTQSLSSLEHEKYELQARYDVFQSDIMLMTKDLEQRQLEVSNLNSTILHFEKEKESYHKRIQHDFETQIQVYRKRMDDDVENIETVWKDKVKKYEVTMKELQMKIQDEQLLRRKAELDINQDRGRMQKTLHEALERLRNSQEDVVDRTLVANLIVSYFKRKRSLDVLNLIGRVLNFNDDQKVAVGLKPPQINIVSSIFNTIIGPPAKPVEVDGDNLAELWVNFLLVETEADPKKAMMAKSSTSPRAPDQPTSLSSTLDASLSPSNSPRYQPNTPPKQKAYASNTIEYLPSPAESDMGAFSLEPESPIFLKKGSR